jgi:diacylglycerol kinase family enzyme
MTTHDTTPRSADRIGVIANLGARSVRRDGLDREGLARELGARGTLATFDSPRTLRRAVRRLRRGRVDSLVVVGGDGTLSAVATQLERAWGRAPPPALVPLPGGSMNSTARALGMPALAPREAVRRLREDRSQRERSLQSLRVDGGWRRPRLGFLFANGLVGEYVDYARRHGGSTAWNSLRVAAALTASAFVNGGSGGSAWSERWAEVDVDGVARHYETFKTLVAVGAIHLPAPLAPFPVAEGAHEGELVYLLNAMPRETLLRNALPVLRGSARSPLHLTGYARALRVRTPGRFMVDGEIYEADAGLEVSITAGPRFCCVTFAGAGGVP